MSPPGDARAAVLIGAVVGVAVLLLFVLSLGAVVLVSRSTTNPDTVVATDTTEAAHLSRTNTTTTPVVETSTSSAPAVMGETTTLPNVTVMPPVVMGETTALPNVTVTPPEANGTETPRAQPETTSPAVASPPAVSTVVEAATAVTEPPVVPTATALPSATTTVAPTGTASPVAPTATVPPPTATATPQPSATVPVPTATATPSPTTVPAAFYWPDTLPAGMQVVAEDSWPFRIIAPGRETEPFLVFRGAESWLLIRNQATGEQPVPRSATSGSEHVGGAPATRIQYQSSGQKLVVQRDGLNVQMSGDGVSIEELRRAAESLRPVTAEALRTRLRQEAARQKQHVTLLWPSVLPTGVTLAPGEVDVQLAQPANGPQADRYVVTFRGAGIFVQLGGGAAPPPNLVGQQERITTGSLTGHLISSGNRFLLVVDGVPAGNPGLYFPEGGARRLPIVQRGPVFVSTENLNRAQFDQLIAALQPLRTQEFIARSRGQTPTNLGYQWPSKLPPGYTIDIQAVKVGFDDFLLQGGLPYFELTVAGPSGTATIRGGRESTGQTLSVPEGADVERITANIHGRVASGARTPDGALVVWLEAGTTYAVTSRSLPLDQLVALGQALQPVDAARFFQNIR